MSLVYPDPYGDRTLIDCPLCGQACKVELVGLSLIVNDCFGGFCDGEAIAAKLKRQGLLESIVEALVRPRRES